MNDNKAIFLHTLWRTSSTWWWAQFRNDTHFRAYYEPFHENLLTRTHAQCVESHTSKPKADIFRHPSTPEHYFSEYPLRNHGGVDFFEQRFTLDDFVHPQDAKDVGMARYIQSLIDYATSRGEDAFFKFSRSALRGAWIKKNFGGTHAYLLRDPAAMFESSLSFVTSPRSGGPGNYFLACPVMIVAQNSKHPLFADLAKRLNLEPFHSQDFKTEIGHFGKITDTLDEQTHRDISMFLWTISLAQATLYADMLIDADMANEPSYRTRVIEGLSKRSRKNILLTGTYKLPASQAPLMISPHVKKEITAALSLIKPSWNMVTPDTVSLASLKALKSVHPGFEPPKTPPLTP